MITGRALSSTWFETNPANLVGFCISLKFQRRSQFRLIARDESFNPVEIEDAKTREICNVFPRRNFLRLNKQAHV